LPYLLEGHQSEFTLNVRIDLNMVESNIQGLMGFILGADSLAIVKQQLQQFPDNI
jgi:hypothetical protein